MKAEDVGRMVKTVLRDYVRRKKINVSEASRKIGCRSRIHWFLRRDHAELKWSSLMKTCEALGVGFTLKYDPKMDIVQFKIDDNQSEKEEVNGKLSFAGGE